MVDKFIAAIKEKRDEHLAAVTERITDQNGHYDYDDRKKDTDLIISAVLDVVEEQYESIVTATAIDSEGEDIGVDMSISPNLSTLYMEEVNT